MNKLVIFLVIQFLSLILYSQTGSIITTVKLSDVRNSETSIPFLGEKVVVIFYVDPDVQDLTNPLSEALEAEKFPLDKFAIIGIANCKDTWLPNAAIRIKARHKQERYPRSLILLDYERTLSQQWNLGECNNKLLSIIIGKDLKIKYLRRLSSIDESMQSIPDFLEVIKKELKQIHS
ncbi:MAG: YtfJ family protein [Clostridiales bacterium]